MRKLSIILVVLLLFSCSSNANNEANNASADNSDITVTRGEDLSDDTTSDTSGRMEPTDESSSDDAGDYDSGSALEGESDLTVKTASTLLKKKDDGSFQQYDASGQLTAGEWNDNEDFDYFMQVLNNNDWYRMKSYWQFTNFTRLEFKITNKDQVPMNHVRIDLHDEQGQVFYTGYTDNQGYAVLYPFINMTFIQEPHIEATLTVLQSTYEIVDMNPLTQTYNVVINEKASFVEELDLMLVVDTTGSMGDELSYIKEELEDVIRRVENNNQGIDIRVSGNYYRDFQDDYVVRSYPFRQDVLDVVDELRKQRADGGGDYEEAVVEALEDAVYNHQWRSGATKLMFLVLDAPPHHTEDNIRRLHEVIRSANEKGIRIIPVASSGVDKETEFLLRFMETTTNGTYVFLTDHSGIGNSHLTPTIGQYKVEYLNDLMVRIINEYVE